MSNFFIFLSFNIGWNLIAHPLLLYQILKFFFWWNSDSIEVCRDFSTDLTHWFALMSCFRISRTVCLRLHFLSENNKIYTLWTSRSASFSGLLTSSLIRCIQIPLYFSLLFLFKCAQAPRAVCGVFTSTLESSLHGCFHGSCFVVSHDGASNFCILFIIFCSVNCITVDIST